MQTAGDQSWLALLRNAATRGDSLGIRAPSDTPSRNARRRLGSLYAAGRGRGQRGEYAAEEEQAQYQQPPAEDVPPAPPAAAPAEPSESDELQRLAGPHASGGLTDDEFSAAKLRSQSASTSSPEVVVENSRISWRPP